jgi:hypothetical protein
MFSSKLNQQQQQQQKQWTIEHLSKEEPEAAAYIHHDWDDSTLASTPSIDGKCPHTTILRNAGEPSTIIFSHQVDPQPQGVLAVPSKAMKLLWKLLKLLLRKLTGDDRDSSANSMASTLQPSLGVNGVMV